jgi:hypothetical protein
MEKVLEALRARYHETGAALAPESAGGARARRG